jgi:predicted DNA-binding transcriptional regulator YafY
MRASRLVNTLLLLQSRSRLTAEELAAELEVSTRTVYRDLQALAEAGVPVYGVAGAGGGYRLVDGYRTRLTGMSAPEAGALLLVDLSVPLRALGLGPDLLAARLKVAAALPEAVASRAGDLAGRVHLDLPGWFETADSPPALALLAEAVLSDQMVRFGYAAANTSPRPAVEPLGLVLKGRAWYLVARRDGRLLTYAVRRVHRPELLDTKVARPADFDLAATWEQLVGEFEASLPSVRVLVRTSAVGLARLPRLVDTRSRQSTDWEGEAELNGWKRLWITFERIEHAGQALLGLGAEVEVLEPEELRSTMAAAAAALSELYPDEARAARPAKSDPPAGLTSASQPRAPSLPTRSAGA